MESVYVNRFGSRERKRERKRERERMVLARLYYIIFIAVSVGDFERG